MFFKANFKRSIGDTIAEQQQQQSQQSTSNQYDTNKMTSSVPATKANGFPSANPIYQQQQEHLQPVAIQQQNQQQIDKVTGLPIPVPAPRRSNSIPLGDGVEGTTSASSSSLTTITSPTSTQNGTIPQSTANSSSPTFTSQPTATTSTTGTTTDSTETQVRIFSADPKCTGLFYFCLALKNENCTHLLINILCVVLYCSFVLPIFFFFRKSNLFTKRKNINGEQKETFQNSI